MAESTISAPVMRGNRPICRAPDCTSVVDSHGLCPMHVGRWKRLGRYDLPTFEEKFWARVDKSAGPDACWPWTGRKAFNGFPYGIVFHDHRHNLTHRIAWTFANGPIPDGMKILHSCDNPPCCNPKHLFCGTQMDNCRDRDQKGRAYIMRGEEVHTAKATAADVAVIRTLFAAGETTTDIAFRFGFTRTLVYAICVRKTWKHLP